jgi:mono/diheme cytochrome c family protein
MKGRCPAWWSAATVLAGLLLLLLGWETVQGPALAAGAAARPFQQQAQQTVLDGVYAAAQADRGGAVYEQHCASCHDGADVDGPPLTGSPFVDRWREDSLASLFEFIKTGMPQTTPGSLPAQSYLDILAYLLHENDYPAGTRELTTAIVDSTLMVGPSGPQPLPSGALVGVVGCLTKAAAGDWTLTRAAQPARVRAGNSITAAEETAAAAATPGTGTFALQNVGDAGTALPGEGHTVLVKGALSQRAGVSRVHVTAAKSVGGTCH